jgi:galactose mutarotase-like enzyme
MKLSNDIITIEVNEHGAELVSLKKEGREYLWNGDPAYWNRHAPILFPVVGKPYNNELHVVGDQRGANDSLVGDQRGANDSLDGKAYPMKQHGFARDSEFEPLGDGRLRLIPGPLSENYPYRLGLEVCYRLQRSTVEVVWTVENLDPCDAWFQIGAHPGFMLPDYHAEDATHGFIRYYDREGNPVGPCMVSALEDGNRVPRPIVNIADCMPITADTFAHDALMFEGGQVARAVLCDREGNAVLGVGCPQAEAYGIWAPHKEGCPFVCLEPWCGICDPKGFTGDISSRQYIHRLAPNGRYTFTYTIEVYR